MTFLTSLSFHCQKKKRKTTLCTWSTYLQVAYRSRIWLCCNPTSGATKSHSQMRCSKTRPRLEIASEQKQKKRKEKKKENRCLVFVRYVHCYFVSLLQASSPRVGCASNCAVASHSCAETPFRSGHSCRAWCLYGWEGEFSGYFFD